MKASEALRIGAANSIPLKAEYVLRTDDVVAACALGCIYLADHPDGRTTRMLEQVEAFEALHRDRAELYTTSAVHPVDGSYSPLDDIVTDLNDYHDWPRERIADWLAGQGY